MSQAPCTATFPASCERVDGSDTSTHVGGPTGKPTLKPSSTQPKLQRTWKSDGASEFSSVSNTKNGMHSSLQEIPPFEEEVEKRKIERDAAAAEDATARAKKKKKKNSVPIPNKNHMKVRAVVDAGSKWETDLKDVHGLSDEEVSMVTGIATKYYNADTFPAFDSEATRGIDFYRALAKPGWHHLKEVKNISLQFPRESGEQTCINGTWKMLPSFEM